MRLRIFSPCFRHIVVCFILCDHTNDSVFTGGWKDGLYSGDGKLLHADGSVSEGQWRGGKLNGKGSNTKVNGCNGHWKGNKRHGRGKIIYANKSEYDGE